MSDPSNTAPSDLTDFVQRIEKSSADAMPALVRAARHELSEDEWPHLIEALASKVDTISSPLLVPLVALEALEFDWAIESFYSDLIAQTDFDPAQMLELMAEALAARGEKDRWALLNGFRQWASARRGRAMPALEAIAKGEAPLDLLAPALRAGLEQDRKPFLEFGLRLIGDAADPLAETAGRVLADAQFLSKAASRRALTAICERLLVSEDDVRSALFGSALGLGFELGTPQTLKVVKLADPEDPQPYQLACARQLVIARSSPDARTLSAFADLFLNGPSLTPAAVKALDDGFSRWLKKSEGFAPVGDALVGLVEAQRLHISALESSALAILGSEPIRRDALFARLLALDNYAGARAVFDVIVNAHDRSIEPRCDFEPLGIDAETAKRIARRVTGVFAILPVSALSILLSLLRTGPASAHAEIADHIVNPILISFWEDGRALLEKQREEEDQSLSTLIADMINALDGYVAAIKSVGFIDEMFPSERQRFLRAMKRDADARAISRKAKEGSLLASLFPVRIILNGDSAIYRVFDGDGEAQRAEQPMQSIEHAQALPRLDAIDPFGYWYLRLRLREGQRP